MPGPQAGDLLVTKQGADLYLIYKVDLRSQVHVGELNLSPITNKLKESYSPHLISLGELIKEEVRVM